LTEQDQKVNNFDMRAALIVAASRTDCIHTCMHIWMW